jgi:hypothetical protein
MGDAAEAGLELARRTDDPRLISAALDAIHAFLWAEGRYAEGLESARERQQLVNEATGTPTIEVERNDAMHMMIETLLQTGDFREAARLASEARELDLSHGAVYAGWARELVPAFFLGEWDGVLRMAALVREAWTSEERPPISPMGTGLACAGAIHAYRGDEVAAEDWFAIARAMSRPPPEGVWTLQSEADVHRGRSDRAADRMIAPEGPMWWRTLYVAERAESFVAAGREEALEALVEAEREVAEQPMARAIVDRARGQSEGDQGRLEAARAAFEELECPHQEARTAWLLGGERRRRAEATFARLGMVPPAR